MSLSNAIAIIRRQDAKVKVEVPATGNRKAYSYMREGSDNPANPKSSVNKKAIAIAGVVGVGALTAGVLAMRQAKKGEPNPNNPSTPEWEKGIKDRPETLYSVFHKSDVEKNTPLDIDEKDITIETAGHADEENVNRDYAVVGNTKTKDLLSDISSENIRKLQEGRSRAKGLQAVAKSKIKDGLPDNYSKETSVFTVKNKKGEDVYFLETGVPTQRKDWAGRTITNYYKWRLPNGVKPEDVPTDWAERLSSSMEKHIKESSNKEPNDLDPFVKSFTKKYKGRVSI